MVARHERSVSALRARPDGAAPAAVQAGAVPGHRAEPHHAFALCLGLTAIRLAYRGPARAGGLRHRRRGAPRRRRRAAGAAAQGHVALRRRARLAGRFREFRRRPGADPLQLHPAPTCAALGWIAALVFAIAAGLRLARFNVMLDDPEPAGMEEELLRRHGGAGRRDHRAAAALPVSSSGVPMRARRGPAGARLRARDRAF